MRLLALDVFISRSVRNDPAYPLLRIPVFYNILSLQMINPFFIIL